MDKGVHTFTKGISMKLNVIERLEFELTYYNVTVEYGSHYTTGYLPLYDKSYIIKLWYELKGNL